MDTQGHNISSPLKCQLKIIKAKNLDFVPAGDLFIRYYLFTGTGKKIRLNTHEVAAVSDPCWNECITLECHSDSNTVELLQHQSIVFELRWRRPKSSFSRIVGSKLLGRAEIAWREVLGSANTSIEKWASVTTVGHAVLGLKPAALQVGLRVGLLESVEKVERRAIQSKKGDKCGCRHADCSGGDDEIFAAAAAFEMM